MRRRRFFGVVFTNLLPHLRGPNTNYQNGAICGSMSARVVRERALLLIADVAAG